MAASGYTPISIYHSTTASAVPVNTNLVNGELAINIADGKLYYKDSGGTVQVIATKGAGTIGGSNTQVQYNSSGALAGSANFTFNGTTATINALNLTNALGAAYGGTAQSTYTQGDLLYASAANTLSKLAIGSNNQVMTSSGSLPQWSSGLSITTLTASDAVTFSATTQNIVLGASQTSGGWTAGGPAQTGLMLIGQSTKTHSVLIADGPTESGATKTVAIGDNGVSGSTTAITIGSTNGTTITLNGTVNATTVNVTTLDLTNLEVTNIKAKDGTAAITITDSSGAVTVSSAFAANGGVTIGDASGDGFTINSSAVSTPNGLNFDSNTFVIDATNNRVGINNASPTVALDVTGALTISGNAILGDASTDTVQVNGYMGVGGAPGPACALTVASTALTSSQQFGVSGQITGSSAATSLVAGVDAYPQTANASFTTTNVAGFYARAGLKGASNTASNWHGVYISDQTQGTNNYGITSLVSSGSNKWNIYASGTANNAFAGNVRIGSTTAPTNALDVTGAMTVSGNTTLGDAATDTVTVNGYMAVGGALNSGIAVRIGSSALGGATQRGAYADVTFTSASTTRGAAFESNPSTAVASFTVTDVMGFSAQNVATLGAGSTITNQHGVYVNDQTRGTNNFGITSLVSSGSNKWNIYASGTAANYFAGNVGIGTSSPDSLFHIESSSSSIIRLTDNDGSVEAGSIAGKIEFENFDATSGGVNAYIQGTNLSNTEGDIGLALGTGRSGSPVERLGLSLTEAVFNDPGNDYDFRVESDTNTHALFVEGTNSNVKIGGSAERATTVGTNHLDIFNGTAPVGTLTNGISLYSSSGEAYVMDAAGNATLFSPHDRETNEWIFKSKHTPTGKVLKIDVERLLKFVNDHFGLDAVHEFIEE